MKSFMILLALSLTSTAFSEEHLSSISLDQDLAKLPKNSILKFNKDIQFRSYADIYTEFTYINPRYRTSTGKSLMCTLHSKQGHPGLEHNAVVPADSIARVKNVVRKDTRISDRLGGPYTIELDAETPERIIPLIIRCMRTNYDIEKVENLPSDLTIQDFVDKGVEDFTLTLSENLGDEKNEDVKPEVVVEPVRPEVVVQPSKIQEQIPKVDEYRDVKISKTLVDCRVEDESNKATLPFEASEDSLGNVSVDGSYYNLSFKLNFNSRGTSSSSLVVQTGFYSFSKTLPGLGAIEFKSGMMSRLMGAKNNFRVECYPSSKRVVTETIRELVRR